MPDQTINNQDPLRYIHRFTDAASYLPSLDTTEYIDIYKGEVVVNTSERAPALYIRSGAGTNEAADDHIVRIGNVIISDFEPALGNQVDRKGIFWYSPLSGGLFLHNATMWERMNPEAATEDVPGILGVASDAQVAAELSNDTAITPAKLRYWADYHAYVKRRASNPYVYVDGWGGDDSIENDGSDPSRPLLTIERAALEVARRKVLTIFVAPGNYVVDNRPGVATTTEIAKTAKGPVNPLRLNAVVSSFSLSNSELTISNALTLDANQQLFFMDDDRLVGHAIVSSYASNKVMLRKLEGTVHEGCTIYIGQPRAFNALGGGVILANGAALVGLGKVTLRPKYVPPVGSARSALVKLTAGGSVQNITFSDSSLLITHHLLSLASFVTKQDLVEPSYGIYSKASYLDDVTYAAVNSELLVANALAASVSNCEVASSYGLCGLDLTSEGIDGFKYVSVTDFNVVSNQLDANAFSAPGLYRNAWQHFVVRADGDVYVRLTGLGKYTPDTKVELNGAVVNADAFVSL